MGEHCSSTEFSSEAEFYIKCKSRTVRDRYSLLLASKKKNKTKNKSCATNNTGRKEQYILHSRLNHRHRQITEVFECHNKTVTRQTSLQRRRRRLSGNSGRKNVLRKLLRIPYRRLKAGFSVCVCLLLE